MNMTRANLFFLFFFTLHYNSSSAQLVTDKAGSYTGKSKISVNWCRLDSMSFDLQIDDRGMVTGKIGDAIISNGFIKKNLDGKAKYIIQAYLTGAIIRTENINREYINIPLDYKRSKFIGSFSTSAVKMDGKETLILTGSNLVLHKINPKK